MGNHLVLAGGGHAHMMTLSRINELVSRGHRVTVIGPSAHHYYSGMGPGMLGGTYTPAQIRFDTRRVTEKNGGTFVCDRVEHIDANQRIVHLASGETVAYDVLSCNLGSHVPRNLVTEDSGGIYTVKPIEKLMEARQRILEIIAGRKATIAVAGGGPAASEIAGNIHYLAAESGLTMPTVYMCAGKAFMARFPEKVRNLTRQALNDRGVMVDETAFVRTIQTGAVTLESGRTIEAAVIFLALGVIPSPVFEVSGLAMGPDKGLRVNEFLQSVSHPEIFGGGDCIYFEPRPLDKVGVYAVRQNPVLYANLLASLEGRPLQPFDPGGDYLLIFNTGHRTGILKKRGLIYKGRTAFMLKDYIDRRFMRKFQAFEQ
ncbi:MAG: NAD(P)/FAD-dependent oxidoreductase [Thermodesulfobacteriota bacterium]